MKTFTDASVKEAVLPASRMGTKRERHRGAGHDMTKFAPLFLASRLEGFAKDMKICLTGIPSNARSGSTHAYFPALMNCCGMLEYLAGLYVGRTNSLGKKEVGDYAIRFLRQPDYDREAIRILFDAFRNAVAHRGIASGVWTDNHHHHKGRRLTWQVHADTARPALELVASPGLIKYDSPWDCPYTHRVQIRLGRLWRDIRDSVDGYVSELQASQRLQSNFKECMQELYPVP
jgi:hypothetical protein